MACPSKGRALLTEIVLPVSRSTVTMRPFYARRSANIREAAAKAGVKVY